jgi:hypothetical protein
MVGVQWSRDQHGPRIGRVIPGQVVESFLPVPEGQAPDGQFHGSGLDDGPGFQFYRTGRQAGATRANRSHDPITARRAALGMRKSLKKPLDKLYKKVIR